VIDKRGQHLVESCCISRGILKELTESAMRGKNRIIKISNKFVTSFKVY